MSRPMTEKGRKLRTRVLRSKQPWINFGKLPGSDQWGWWHPTLGKQDGRVVRALDIGEYLDVKRRDAKS